MAYRIVDSHVHFWDPVARHHEWLAEVPQLNRRLGPEDYGAGRHELHGFVFVQADCRDEEALAEAGWVAELAASFPLIRGIVRLCAAPRGRAVESHLDALADAAARRRREPPAAGPVRSRRSLTPRSSMGCDSSRSGIYASTSASGTQQLPAVDRACRGLPDTLFVLDHLGKPPVADGALDPWREH